VIDGTDGPEPNVPFTKVSETSVLLDKNAVSRLYGGYNPKSSKHLYGLQRYVELGNNPSGALAVAESYGAVKLLLELGTDLKEVIENKVGRFFSPKTLSIIAKQRKQQVKMYLSPRVAKEH
jgi:hypothetical protein